MPTRDPSHPHHPQRATVTPMTTVNYPDVPLVKAGTWAAGTGDTLITVDDLAAMEQAYRDQLVDRPVIKIGHDETNVFNAALGDGAPAYGWLGRVGVGDGSAARPDPNTLYADYVGMPSKLAEVAPSAFRRRSVEIAWGVKTAASKTYRAVLTGVALLGVQPPAVKGLADVVALYSAAAAVVETSEVTVVEVAEGDVDQKWLAGARAEVTALAAAHGIPDDRRDAALERLDRLAGVTTTIPAAADGDTGSVPPPEAGRSDGVPGSQPAGPTTTSSKESTRMPITKSDIDKAFEDAGEEGVAALLEGQAVAPVAPAAPAAPAEPVDETPAATAASAGNDDTVVVTKAMWDNVQAQLAAGAQLAAAADAARRDSLVEDAFLSGRITADERTTWRTKLDENEGVTASLLSALAPRFVTTTTVPGHATDLSQLSAAGDMPQAEKDGWNDFFGSIGAEGAKY